ncbi:MAG: RdgB/HAM1 family non-canonical purine NTP pyrophosphatase [Tannerellaceae bacterium]|jgi:non-canonical purine NTP pyrophosphatase (RdgB/HAM1 family)|nr:RdgB/HAM1 family non-canonical purine NTP pyrophosphatase [Tannerellaceae bacterium]
MELVFATHNRHKFEEAEYILSGVSLRSLADIGCTEDIPETELSLRGNALLKATHVYTHYRRDCFADDTGLEVEILDNKPGVHSARYSDEGSDQANLDKLLKELAGITHRKARFRTVIALILAGKQYFFEGTIDGNIAGSPRGTEGFGYDSVFIPQGYNISFAQLPPLVKNRVSHRCKALQALSQFLGTLAAILLCLLVNLPAKAQHGIWKPYPSYHSVCMVEETPDEVFALGGFDRNPFSSAWDPPSGALFVYGKEDHSITLYTKENGLSDVYISRFAYSQRLRTLLLLYTNGNIDLLTKEGIYNLPHLLHSQGVRDKTVSDIFFDGDYAYLAANFGIMVINLRKREITDTYKIGVVHSVFLRNGELVATTDSGVFAGKQGDNLLDKANWKELTIDVDTLVRKVFALGEQLVVLGQDEVLYFQNDGQWQPLLEGVWDIFLKAGKLIVHRWGDIGVYTAINHYRWISIIAAHDLASLSDGLYWVASGEEGLKAFSDEETLISGIRINGPKRDHADFLTFHNAKLWVTGDGGGRFRTFFDATLMLYDGTTWHNFDEKAVSTQANHPFAEATCVAVDPQDDNHCFVGTWGDGLFEFLNGEYVRHYDYTNSTLESFVASDDPQRNRYVRIDGLRFDDRGNLWVTNTSGDLHAIKVRKPDGQWLALSYDDVLPAQVVMDDILITRNNHKWINIISGSSAGILAVDDAGTIDNPSDDKANFFASFRSSDGQTSIAPSAYYCMAEDRDGRIWLGTNLGPVICPVPDYAIQDPSRMYASRIVRTDEEGRGAFFLDGESVRAIAVDGGNRKWLGTQSSGLIVLSEDGQETVAHFTTANSLLPSNLIRSIAIHPQTGEVFVGTDKGIVSYASGVTPGRPDYTNVKAFPNPVRPDYQGFVTVTNLVEDSYVRITDLNGHPLAEGNSVGGQFFWNCRRPSGEHVATGVYLVMAATADAAQSVVAKIMVIR